MWDSLLTDWGSLLTEGSDFLSSAEIPAWDYSSDWGSLGTDTDWGSLLSGDIDWESAFGTTDIGSAGIGSTSWLSNLFSGGAGGYSDLANVLGLGAATLGTQYLGSQSAENQAEKLAALQNQYSQQTFDKLLAAQQQFYTQQKQDIQDASKQSLENWQKYAFPNKEAIEAYTAQGLGQIGQATKTAREQATEQAASRGVRGGALGSSLAGIEKQGIQNQSDFMNKVLQFANTPQQAAPISMQYPGQQTVPNYQTPTVQGYSSFGENMADILSNITGQSMQTYLNKLLYG